MTETPAQHGASSSDRTRDHLANERTFLAWIRTGVAFVIFGFAIGRFGVALHQLFRLQGQPDAQPGGHSLWLGVVSVGMGVLVVMAGWLRYNRTKKQLLDGQYEPSGFLIGALAILTALIGVAMMTYLVIEGSRL